MNRIRKKLASDRGASITFALLLFLVCAVLSSVIIVAATAASGRMSRLSEMDKRYYSVTSAAALIKEVLDGQSVEVEHKKVVRTIRKANNPTMSGETSETPDDRTSDFTLYTLEGKDAPSVVDVRMRTEDDPEELANYTDFLLTRIAHQYVDTSDVEQSSKLFPLTETFKLEVGNNPELTCDIAVTMNTDGTVIFDIKNNIDSVKDKDQFILTAIFKADVEEVKGSKIVEGTPEKVESGYQAVDEAENVTTTKVILRFVELSEI